MTLSDGSSSHADELRLEPERAFTSPAPAVEDYSRVEQVVDRLARLALHAHTLAERMESIEPTGVPADQSRDRRIGRLRTCVTSVQQALVAASSGAEIPDQTATARRRGLDRRHADRRATAPVQTTPVRR